jgi:hypothetical protein
MTCDPRGRIAGGKGFSGSFLHGVINLIEGRRLILFDVLFWGRPLFLGRFFHKPLFYRCGKKKGRAQICKGTRVKIIAH